MRNVKKHRTLIQERLQEEMNQDNMKNTEKMPIAGDAYIRCHEFKENGQLDLARSRNGLNDGLEEVYYSL